MSILQIIGSIIAVGAALVNSLSPTGGSWESTCAFLTAFIIGAAMWGVSFLVN